MDENKTILTDEEVNDIIDAANETNADNESIKKLHEAKEKSLDELLDSEEEQKKVAININPSTGIPEGVSIARGYGLDKDTDLLDDFLDASDENIGEIYTTEQIGKVMDKDLNNDKLSDEDLIIIKKALDRKNNNGIITYNDLPESLKKQVDETVRKEVIMGWHVSHINRAKNMIANEIIEKLFTNILQDNIESATLDLETSIKNLVSKEYSDINDSQHKQHIAIYTQKMIELADTKYKDDPEKKALLYAVSNGYKQAHSLSDMYNAYSKGGKIKIKKIDIEKLHKLIRDFELKYEKSKFTIRDMSYAVDILVRHVNSRFSVDTIKAFIAVFCKYTNNMKPSNVAEHTFMYYFINNILTLDIPTTDEDVTKYNNEFIENVNHFLNLIDSKLNN